MAKKARKAKAANKSKKGSRKAKVQKKVVSRKKRSARPAKARKNAKKTARARKAVAPSPTGFGPAEFAAARSPAVAPVVAVTPAVSVCVNAYLDANRPGWNDDGAGNSKNLSDLHVDVPLFLDNVRGCLEKRIGYTFDVNAVTAKTEGGTVTQAKQEIVLAAKRK